MLHSAPGCGAGAGRRAVAIVCGSSTAAATTGSSADGAVVLNEDGSGEGGAALSDATEGSATKKRSEKPVGPWSAASLSGASRGARICVVEGSSTVLTTGATGLVAHMRHDAFSSRRQ